MDSVYDSGTLSPDPATNAQHWLERHHRAAFAAILAIFASSSFSSSTNKPLWYDEMYTFTLATRPSWHLFQLALPADGNPPLYALLARLCMKLLGAGELGVRMPAFLAFCGTLILLYTFVRNRAGTLCALLGMVMLATNHFAEGYAFEARPYSFILFFTMLALYAWQRCTDPAKAARRPLWLLTLAVAGGVLSHHFAIISIGLPLLAGEAVRLYERRRVDLPLTLAALLGLLPLVYTTRLMHAMFLLTGQHKMENEPLTLIHLVDGYAKLTGPPLTALLLLTAPLVFAVVRAKDSSVFASLLRYFTLPELAAGVTTLFNLGVVFALLSCTTRYYAGPRYGIATALGFALVTAFVASTYAPPVQFALLAVAMVPMIHPRVPHLYAPDPIERSLYALGDKPIAIGRGLLFPTAWHYADEELRSRLFYPVGAEFDRRGTYWLEDMAATPKEVAPPHMVPYRDFLQHTSDFYLVVDYQSRPDEADLIAYLADHRYRLEDHFVSDDCPVRVISVSAPKPGSSAGLP